MYSLLFKIFLFFLFGSFTAQAQFCLGSSLKSDCSCSTVALPRKIWILEINTGQSMLVGGFANGVYATERSGKLNSVKPNYVRVGAMIFLTQKLGLKADFSFDNIETKNKLTSWDSQYYRLSLRGCSDVSKVFGVKEILNDFGILANAGFVFSHFNSSHYSTNEFDLGFVYGITPYYRINNALAVNLDFNFQKTYKKHLNWDGSMADKNENLFGAIDSVSLGFLIYL
ncbi:hypothetical protein [Flavobacterium sp. AG291]|uniref:hypothetical protein n=1 Tax=Flavobacterium sp. AG291 TaxID=2184000 RepID=UPI000E2D7D62|nr:hypothetical protein [Flavobacterium sp. AG291]RDI11232.1 hypothetical protein DEU42_106166 [Flavobacterium sp. AG291]